MITTYIGLGSNLNNPLKQIEKALEALSLLPATQLTASSNIYTTSPIGFVDQPDFLNAVCCLETTLTPESLLEHLLIIERSQLRVRGNEKNGPRTLDLDILIYGDETISTDSLKIPHPRLTERAFVMVPLMEIAPDLVMMDGRSVKLIAEDKKIQQQKIKMIKPIENT
jgi:2-amino-4-hydroxy-6-hydroxymethyldihydropteridine diphosphokinase